MDNQHKLVSGYRDFNKTDLDAINSIKLAEQDIGQLWQQIRNLEGVDHRCLATAKTQLQQAFSWFVRAVAKPLDVFELVLPEPEPSTFLSRMKEEREQLFTRISKLTAFLDSDASREIPAESRGDLVLQALAMNDYLAVLDKRIGVQEEADKVSDH